MNLVGRLKRKKAINPAGFTLIEFVIVIAIMAVFAFVVVPNAARYIRKARVANTENTLRQVKRAIDEYRQHVGKLPQSLDDLVRLPAGMTKRQWDGPYIGDEERPLESAPQDAWKQEFQYLPQGHTYKVYSLGPNGESGTEDEYIYPQ